MPSSPPGVGFKGILQYALEATWGTKPTITKRFPYYECNLRPQIDRHRPAVVDGVLSQVPLQVAGQCARMSLVIPVTYSRFPFFMDLIMGTSTYGVSGGTTTGSGPYVHAWGYATPIVQGFKDLLNSIAVEKIVGGIPASECSVGTGLKVISARLACSVDDPVMKAEIEFFGRRYQTSQAITTVTRPTAASLDYVMFQHLTQLYDGSDSDTTTEQTKAFELSVDTMGAEDRIFMEGTGFYAEPYRKMKPKVTWSLTKEFQKRAGLDAYIANTKGNCLAQFASGGLEMVLYMNGGMMEAPETPEKAEGFIEQKFTWEAEDVGTPAAAGSTLHTRITNNNSSLQT